MALYFCAIPARRVARSAGYRRGERLLPFKAAATRASPPNGRSPELLVDLLPTMIGQSKIGVVPAVEPFRAAGLHSAMYIIPLLAAILAVVLFAASRTVTKDVDRLRAWMREAQPHSLS
jgi:hypothetical protein